MGRNVRWTNSDIAVHRTLEFQKRYDAGRGMRREDFQVAPARPVRPMLSQDEIMMASAGARLYLWNNGRDFQAVANPVHMSTIALNKRGQNFAVGSMLGTAAVNVWGRRQAAKTGWELTEQAPLTVSTEGVYLETMAQGVLVFSFDGFQTMEWEGQGRINGFFSQPHWQGRLLIESDWAELIFVMWMSRCHPHHPARYSWFTQDWLDRATQVLGHNPIGPPTLPSPSD